MSRFPFMEFADAMLKKAQFPFEGFEDANSFGGFFSERTLADLRRRYVRQSKIFQQLYKDKMVSTTSPQRFKVDDIRVFILYIRRSGVGHSDINKHINALERLCVSVGNPAVARCLALYPNVKSRVAPPRHDSMDSYIFDRIVSSFPAVPSDLVHLRAYGLVALALATGCRTQELQYSRVSDLDFKLWVFKVSHPKGIGSYGVIRYVPIPPEFRTILSRYVKARVELPECNSRSALFPSSITGGFISDNALRVIRLLVCEELGVQFDFRLTRRTFGQHYLDADLELEKLSVLMGHKTTATTEDYYCRQQNKKAIDSAIKTWGSESE